MMQVPQQAKLEVTVKSSKSKKSQRQANSRHLQRCAGHRIQNNKLSQYPIRINSQTCKCEVNSSVHLQVDVQVS